MRMTCHTPEQTRLYERGYPYVVQLVDGHKDDKKPASIVGRAFRNYWGPYHVRWPRLTATAFVRACAALESWSDWGTPEQEKAATATGPMTADEARSVIQAWFAIDAGDDFHAQQHAVHVLESLVGNEVVLEAITSELERLPKKRWPNKVDEDGGPAVMAYLTGLLLLRSERAGAIRKRLEAVYQAAAKAKVDAGEHTIRGALDLALHGNEGAQRTLADSHWQYWHYYLMVDDPKVHLARLADNSKSDWVPEARILFLAGPEMLPVYTQGKALRQGKRLVEILEDFAMFSHPRITELMLEMMSSKSAGEVPANYFRAQAKTLHASLEGIARSKGPLAAPAKAALKLVG